MIKERKYVVRVVMASGDILKPDSFITTLLDQFHRAGTIKVHRTDMDGICFDIIPPAGTAASSPWAEKTAERMKLHNFNAVVAPATPDNEKKP